MKFLDITKKCLLVCTLMLLVGCGSKKSLKKNDFPEVQEVIILETNEEYILHNADFNEYEDIDVCK